MRKSILTVIITLLVSTPGRPQELLWSVVTDTNNLYNTGYLQLDEQDNIYIEGGKQVITLMKLDKNGLIQHIVTQTGEEDTRDMILDEYGKVYIAGFRETAVTQQDALLQVYEDEILLFEQQYDYVGKNDRFLKLCLDDDNNIYACGMSYNSNTEQIAIIAKYSAFGIPIWIQHFGESMHHIYVSGLHLASNGDILVIGYRSPTSPGPVELVYLRYNNNGILQAELVNGIFGYQETHPTFSIIDSQDNLYIGGYVYTSKDAGFLCKISNDNIAWSQVFLNPAGNSSLFSAALDESGNLYCCGIYEHTNYDGYIIKMSDDGGLLNESFYAMPGDQFVQLSKIVYREGYVYLCGAAEGIGTGYDALITKYNSELELMWDHVYNGFENNEEYATRIALDTEGNIIIGGLSIGTSGYKALVQKYSNPLSTNEISSVASKIFLYPNPAQDLLHLHSWPQQHELSYFIYNLNGKLCLSGLLQNQNAPALSLGNLDNGMYILQISNGEIEHSFKFIKK